MTDYEFSNEEIDELIEHQEQLDDGEEFGWNEVFDDTEIQPYGGNF